MNIKIEPGAKVQITDKPIINVFGDVVQHKEEHIHFDAKSNTYSNAEEAEVVEEIKDDNLSPKDGEQPIEQQEPAGEGNHVDGREGQRQTETEQFEKLYHYIYI